MWKCHKCGKPVFFAERKQSLGYDWHPECLRCEECGKRLDPGQHAEHKGVPYCHVPCYGALFGPQLFGHGTRVESHKSFGQKGTSRLKSGPSLPKSQIDCKLKAFNQFYDGKSGEIRSREVNGRLILEGALRIYWGVQGVIHLKEDDDQRTVVTVRKRNSCRFSNGADDDEVDLEEDRTSLVDLSLVDTGVESGSDLPALADSDGSVDVSPNHTAMNNGAKSLTLPHKLDLRHMEWDELDDLLQVERKVDDTEKLYQTMPAPLPSLQTSPDTTSTSLSNQSSLDSSPTESESNNTLTSTNSDKSDSPAHQSKDLDIYSLTLDDEIEKLDAEWMERGAVLNRSMSGPDCLERTRHPYSPFGDGEDDDEVFAATDSGHADSSCDDNSPMCQRRPAKTGSVAIKRRPGKKRSRIKLKRRCSINGHFYNRETSFFTPPHGSQMSVWVTSLVNTQEVINLMLEKYKVDSHSNNFALFVVRDNGEQRRLKEEEYPLLVRVMLGPHEDVAKLFLMDRHNTPEVSSEVAQFLNLSMPECNAILERYRAEEDREVTRVQEKYGEMKKRIRQRMEELKVRL